MFSFYLYYPLEQQITKLNLGAVWRDNFGTTNHGLQPASQSSTNMSRQTAPYRSVPVPSNTYHTNLTVSDTLRGNFYSFHSPPSDRNVFTVAAELVFEHDTMETIIQYTVGIVITI